MSPPNHQVSRLTITLRGLDGQERSTRRLKKALERAPGVVSVYVNPSTEAAFIVYDPLATTPEALLEVVQGENVQTEEMVPQGSRKIFHHEQ